MAPKPTSVSNPSPETDKPALRTNIDALKKTTQVLQPLQPPKSWLDPPSQSLPSLTSTNPDRNNVLLVVPTENKDKVRIVRDYFHGNEAPPHVHLPLPDPRKVASDSQVGEQPYDSAGPEGAFNRVVNAVRHLQSDPEHRRVLEENRIGTVIVGSVENFIVRRAGEGEGGDDVPVDYGFVVLCRVPVARAGSVESAGPWEWRAGISRGVTVPVDYWREAERAGFDDEENPKDARLRFGKVTVGSLLAKHAGLSSANWHEQLAGVSRYDLLGDAMGRMEAPWPEPAAKVE